MKAVKKNDFYGILFGLYIFIVIVNSSLLGNSLFRAGVDILFSIALFVFFYASTRYKVRELIIFTIIIILFLFAGISTRRPYILTYAMFIISAKDADSFKKISKISCIASLAGVAVVIVGCLLGFIRDLTFSRGGGVVAHSLGFGYYHVVSYISFYALLCYLYFRKTKLSWIEIFLGVVINYLLYSIGTVRLTYYLIFVVLALYIVFVKFEWIQITNKAIKCIFTASFPIISFVSIIINYTYNSNNEVFRIINQFSSGRLALGKRALETYGIKLFGQYIQTFQTATDYFYIDCGFIYALLGYGVLFTVAVIIIYSCLCYYACSNNDKLMFIWLFAVLLFTISNNTWIDIYYNPILIAFPIVIKQKNKTAFAKNNLQQTNAISLKEAQKGISNYGNRG